MLPSRRDALRRWFVLSKPLRAPFADGTSVLARTLVSHLPLTTQVAYLGDKSQPLRPGGNDVVISARAMGHAPGILDKAMAMASAVHPLRWRWPLQIFFAPNPRSSHLLAQVAKAMPWRPIVQTITASDDIERCAQWLRPLDHLIVHSQHALQRLHAVGIDPARTTCIYPAVSPAVPHREAPDGSTGLDLLYAGDLDAIVVQRLLAIAQRLRAWPTSRLVIAARPKSSDDAACRARLQEELAAFLTSGQVQLLGRIDDMPAQMRACAIQLYLADHVHKKVDLPLVVLEGLAHGQALIVSQARPIGEILDLAGQQGLSVGMGVASGAPPDAWADAVAQTLGKPQQVAAWRQDSLAVAERCFAPNIMIAAYLALWERVIDQRQRDH